MTGLLICAALGVEARAVRHGLPRNPDGVRVIRIGFGPGRAARAAAVLPAHRALAVVGFGGAVDGDARPGDVLVASEVRFDGGVFPCSHVSLLAGEVGRAGLPVRSGPLVTSDRVVTGAERRRLAGEGALAVDMETGPLAAAAGRPLAAVRVIVDTPRAPLLSVATLCHGAAARRTLRRLGPALVRWAAAAARRPPPAAFRPGRAGAEEAAEIEGPRE